MALDPIARGAAAAAAARNSVSGNAALLANRALSAKMTVPADMRSLRCDGYATAGDGGRAFYRRVATRPSHPATLRTGDRFLPDGTISADNGGWWELDEPAIYITMFGASTASTDNTAAINAASAYVSAKGGGIVIVPAGVFKVRTDASNFLILRPNVRFRSASFVPGRLGDAVCVIAQTADSTGFMFRPGTAKPDSCGIEGLCLSGNGTGYATSGCGGIDLRWPTNPKITTPIVHGCQFRFFAEEALIEDSLNGRFLANVAAGCLMRRTPRTAFAGVFTIGGTDGIIEDCEVGCSVQVDMNMATPAPYNATPLLAALYFKGGNTRSRNNRAETSEIGVVNEGGAIRSTNDHAEFNAAWGWLERGSSTNTINSPYFDNNSGIRVGTNGTYAGFRKDAGSGSCKLLTPTIITGHTTLWGVGIQPLYDIEDAAGGGSLDLILGNNVAYRVWSVDNSARFPALPNLISRGENALPNAMAIGAVVGTLGSGGALPTGWSSAINGDATGLTFAVDEAGDDNGLGYIVLSVTGTAVASGNIQLDFAPANNRPAAVLGENWTFSLALSYNPYAGLTNWTIQTAEQTAAGTDTTSATAFYPGLSGFQVKGVKGLPLDSCRLSVTRTLTNANSRRVTGRATFSWSAGSVCAARIRIALPQLERGTTMGAPAPTRTAPAIGRGAPGYVVAATGGTTAMGIRQDILALDPAAAIAAYTVTLPAAPQGGDRVSITTSQAIAALTVGGGSYPVVGAPATLAPGAAASFVFEPASGKWWRV